MEVGSHDGISALIRRDLTFCCVRPWWEQQPSGSQQCQICQGFIWSFQPAELWKTNVCCVSSHKHPVCGSSLQQPRQTKAAGLPALAAVSRVLEGLCDWLKLTSRSDKDGLPYSVHWCRCLSLPETPSLTHPETMFYQLSGHVLAQPHKMNHHKGLQKEVPLKNSLHVVFIYLYT